MEKIIIANDIPSFEEYLNRVIEISEVSPNELCYQFEVVKPLLERALPDYQIVDTSDNSDTQLHTREYYTLPNKQYTSPDLVIARNYKYENLEDKPDIYAVVEVKEQSAKEMFNKEIAQYYKHLIYEIALYLYVVKKVIATNCRRWQFFETGDDQKTADFTWFTEFFLECKQYMEKTDEPNIMKKRRKDLFDQIVGNAQIKELLNKKSKGIHEIPDEKAKYDEYIRVIYEILKEQLDGFCVKTIDVYRECFM